MHHRRPTLLLTLAVVSFAAFFGSRLLEIPDRSALRGWDNSFYLFWLRSAIIDQDWDFANEIEETNTLTPTYRQYARDLPKTENNLTPNKYGIGWALISAPAFIVAHGFAHFADSLTGGVVRPNGFSAIYQVILQLYHAALAIISLFLSARLLAKWFGRPHADFAIAATFLTSPLIYYQTVNLSMAHNAVFCTLVGATTLAHHLGRSPSNRLLWFLLGLSGGLAIVCRFQAILLALLPAWLALRAIQRVQSTGTRIAAIAAALLGLSIPLFIQIHAWKTVYGSWLTFSYGHEGESFNWFSPEILNILFHPYHGLFYWHPLLLPALAALPLMLFNAHRSRIRPLRIPVALILLSACLVTYLNASWWAWPFGASFGHRAFEGIFFYAMFGFAYLHRKAATTYPSPLPFLRIPTLLFAIGNIHLCTLYCINLIDRNGPVTWNDMLAATLDFYPFIFKILLH